MTPPTTITHARWTPIPISAELRPAHWLALKRKLAQLALIAAMFVGATAIWTLVPAACLTLISELTDSAALRVLAIFVVVPAAMALVGAQLVRLDGLYRRISGTSPTGRHVPAWRRSYSGARPNGGGSALDRVMVASVLVAAVAFATGFLLLAGAPA